MSCEHTSENNFVKTKLIHFVYNLTQLTVDRSHILYVKSGSFNNYNLDHYVFELTYSQTENCILLYANYRISEWS